jgi:dTDP-4-dehydrorhamnose 3,5-epimerase
VIHDVKILPLKQIADERGKIMLMLRRDSEAFAGFGEVYFSCVNPGAVKAWHIHKKMVLNYAVPYGRVKLVLYDERPDSPSKGTVQEIVLGENDYKLVTIPPMIWNGFKGLGPETAIVANCASIPHDPEEIDRLDPVRNNIPYRWDR